MWFKTNYDLFVLLFDMYDSLFHLCVCKLDVFGWIKEIKSIHYNVSLMLRCITSLTPGLNLMKGKTKISWKKYL